MNESKDTIPAEKDGRYQFQISYAEREVTCLVEKEQKMLHVVIDESLKAELKINNDGTLTQVEGTPLPDSVTDFIKRQILG